MSNSLAQTKLSKIITECELHQKRIDHARLKLKQFMPVTAKDYQQLNDDQIEVLDQFLFRFSKLQDAIGQRLFPGVLEALEEPLKEMPYLDRLNRLDQLNIIESKEQWLNLRNMGSKVTHEYEDDPEGMSQALNLVYESYKTLANIFLQAKRYIDEKITP